MLDNIEMSGDIGSLKKWAIFWADTLRFSTRIVFSQPVLYMTVSACYSFETRKIVNWPCFLFDLGLRPLQWKMTVYFVEILGELTDQYFGDNATDPKKLLHTFYAAEGASPENCQKVTNDPSIHSVEVISAVVPTVVDMVHSHFLLCNDIVGSKKISTFNSGVSHLNEIEVNTPFSTIGPYSLDGNTESGKKVCNSLKCPTSWVRTFLNRSCSWRMLYPHSG